MFSRDSICQNLTGPKPPSPQPSISLTDSTSKFPGRRQNIFFNENIPLSELRRIADIEDGPLVDVNEAWTSTKERYARWLHSCATVSCSAYQFHKRIQLTRYETNDDLQLTPPPPGFHKPLRQIKSPNTELAKEMSNPDNQQPVTQNICELSSPPKKKGICKREDRGKFFNENTTSERSTGTLKFYQLKKRFGFITLDEDASDVFLCEDDIVLSGIHHKHFKGTVLSSNPIHFSFRIKTYEENGKIKRKAIEIQLV